MKKIYCLFLCLIIGNSVFSQNKKHTTLIEGGILTYGLATKELGVSFRGVHNFQVISNLYAGFGTGYEKYMLNEVDGKSFKGLPIFAQAKYVLKPENATSFFAALDLGYSVGLNKDKESDFEKITYAGGVLTSPQIGIVFNTKHRKEFLTFSFGYKYQGFTENQYTNNRWQVGPPIEVETGTEKLKGFDNYTNHKYNMHRVSLMLGFGF